MDSDPDSNPDSRPGAHVNVAYVTNIFLGTINFVKKTLLYYTSSIRVICYCMQFQVDVVKFIMPN